MLWCQKRKKTKAEDDLKPVDNKKVSTLSLIGKGAENENYPNPDQNNFQNLYLF